MGEAEIGGGLGPTALGFLGGAAIYTAANWLLDRLHFRAKHRTRPNDEQPSEEQAPASRLAMFVGSRLDNIPENVGGG